MLASFVGSLKAYIVIVGVDTSGEVRETSTIIVFRENDSKKKMSENRFIVVVIFVAHHTIAAGIYALAGSLKP